MEIIKTENLEWVLRCRPLWEMVAKGLVKTVSGPWFTTTWSGSVGLHNNAMFFKMAAERGIRHPLLITVTPDCAEAIPTDLASWLGEDANRRVYAARINASHGVIAVGEHADLDAAGLAAHYGLRIKSGAPGSQANKRLGSLLSTAHGQLLSPRPSPPGELWIGEGNYLRVGYSKAELEHDDGGGAIREKAALALLTGSGVAESLIDHADQLQLKIVGEEYIKGNYIIIPDREWPHGDCDLVTAACAVRGELTSDRVTLISVNATPTKRPRGSLRALSWFQGQEPVLHHLDAAEISAVHNVVGQCENTTWLRELLDAPTGAVREELAEALAPPSETDWNLPWREKADVLRRLEWLERDAPLLTALEAGGGSPWASPLVWTLLRPPGLRQQKSLERRNYPDFPNVMLSGGTAYLYCPAHVGQEAPAAGYAGLRWRGPQLAGIGFNAAENDAARALLGGHDNDDRVEWVLTERAPADWRLLIWRLPRDPGCSLLKRLTSEDARLLMARTGAWAYGLRQEGAAWPDLARQADVYHPAAVAPTQFDWDEDRQLANTARNLPLVGQTGLTCHLQSILLACGWFDPAESKTSFSDILDTTTKGEGDAAPVIAGLLDVICQKIAQGASAWRPALRVRWEVIAAAWQERYGVERPFQPRYAEDPRVAELRQGGALAGRRMRRAQLARQRLSNGPLRWLTHPLAEELLASARLAHGDRRALWSLAWRRKARVNRQKTMAWAKRKHRTEAIDRETVELERRLMLAWNQEMTTLGAAPGETLAAWLRVAALQVAQLGPDAEFSVAAQRTALSLPEAELRAFYGSGVAEPTWLSGYTTEPDGALIADEAYWVTADDTGAARFCAADGRVVAWGGASSDALVGQRVIYRGDVGNTADAPVGIFGVSVAEFGPLYG